jgi:3',5'-cyclic AMP phosphodiesterase CpdA
MKFISRRDFLKYSLVTFATFCTQYRLPVLSAVKTFRPFKFAFVPCLHLSNYRFDDWILYNESLLILQDAVKLLNSLNPHFVVFGGDLIENRQKDLSDMPVMLDVITGLQSPYYVILGDREADLTPEIQKEHITAEFRRNGFSLPGLSWWAHTPVEGVDLVGLDSSVRNQMSGAVSADQLRWLENGLACQNNNLRIVCLHHPIIPEPALKGFYTADGFDLKNADSLTTIFDRYQNVNMVLSGHRHVNKIFTKGSTHYINCPSIVTYPCEFKFFEVTQDYIDVKSYQISYKQIVKKAEEQLIKSEYAKQFPNIKNKELLALHKGKKTDRDQKLQF